MHRRDPGLGSVIFGAAFWTEGIADGAEEATNYCDQQSAYPQSKTKSPADLLKDLPCGAAIVAVEKVAIATKKKSYGNKRRKRHRRRSQQ